MAPDQTSRPEQPRVVRVFVSSTFRDMKEDRDHLVKFIFPQLRKLCEARSVTWGEVDLRWGVPDEDRHEVLPLCLEEIRRCQPYFIGLLGERYGHVPGSINMDLVAGHPWLSEFSNASITELEIIQGVLLEPNMHGHAFFYFRDPSYLEHLPPGCARTDFEHESSWARERLARLKQRIRAASNEGFCSLRESYADVPELGKWVLGDFTRLINVLFPEHQAPGPLELEAAGREAFAVSRARVYIGRPEYFDRLDAHVAGQDPPLAVLGESGIGKSALLANWFIRHRQEHPTDFSLIHFVGSTPDSADAVRLLRRIMLEMKRHFGVSEEIPALPDKIREEFLQWLLYAGSSRIVLVLDRLNQLDDRDHAPDLGWLPVTIPPNCRVIVSTLPGRSLEAIRHRNWPEMSVQPLTVAERRALTIEFLAQFSRRLSPMRVDLIVSAEQASNPLFLRVMLDELRQFGEHERLGDRIAMYLEARNPRELYDRILERWEADYGPDIVRRSLSLIWAARHGLSEAELLDLLGRDGQPLPHVQWTPFGLAAESSLVQKSGLVTFAHDYLRSAVKGRWLRNAAQEQDCHRVLAQYFVRQSAFTGRTIDELPWHYAELGDWPSLHATLTSLPIFSALMARGEREVLAYWLRMPSSYQQQESYAAAWNQWTHNHPADEASAALAQTIAIFMETAGNYDAAIPYLRQAMEIRRHELGEDDERTLTAAHKLAQMLASATAWDEAESLYEWVLERRQRILGPDHSDVMTTLNNLGHLHVQRGDLNDAAPLYQRALETRERVLGKQHPDTLMSLHNTASLLHRQGRLAEATDLYRSVLDARISILSESHPSTLRTLNNLAVLLYDKGDYVAAAELARHAYDIKLRVLGANHHTTINSAVNLANALYRKGDYAEAVVWYRLVVTYFDTTNGPTHPLTQQYMGMWAIARGKAARARHLAFLARILSFFRGWHT